jgi:sugar diacid utilization regulator
MAYSKLSYDRYNERKQIVVRLKRHNEPFAYTADICLANYEKAVEAVKIAADEKNAALDLADAKTTNYNAKCEQEDKLLMALRACIGSDKGKDSDEYVIAGGAKQSDVIAQQMQTREDNKKAAEEAAAKKKAAEESKPN